MRWGVLGAGYAARQFGLAITRTAGNTLVGVASRDPRRAGGLASDLGVAGYDGYSHLIRSGDLDVVYIATTHPHHYEQALAVIEAGLAVVIEKPVALNAEEAAGIFAAATARGVFAMEAMWLKTDPLIREATAVIESGAIGPVQGLASSIALGIPYEPDHRLYDLRNGGGALMDLGVYHVALAQVVLGEPATMSVSAEMLPSGVDATAAMQLGYRGGIAAQLWCSLTGHAEFATSIFGERGYIRFEGPAASPDWFEVRSGTGSVRTARTGDRTYEYEIEEVERCIRAGLTESPLVPQDATVRALALLDGARRTIGLRYPQEQPAD